MQHEFSFYCDQLSSFLDAQGKQELFSITDEQLWHRLKHVVRAQPNTHLILFDKKRVIRATFHTFDNKNRILFKRCHPIHTAVLTPHITLVLPLLKKDALVDAFYTATELGANQIQLVTTATSQNSWNAPRDTQRYEKIMIAAAEQSKQFTLPSVSDEVLSLPDLLNGQVLPTGFRLHCDQHGNSLWETITTIKAQKPTTIVISIGPEGDLLPSERELLYQHNFVACALTPTVVRSTQALVIALGAVRSTVLS